MVGEIPVTSGSEVAGVSVADAPGDGQFIETPMVDVKHENSLHLMDPNAGMGAPPRAVGK